MTTKSQRRLYAEGVARRAEILQVALSAYQSSGRQGPTLKSIAQAAGLTEAGVLHYFDSKDALLAAIIEERDHLYAETYDVTTLDGVWAVLAHTVRTPWPGQALRRHERRGGRPPAPRPRVHAAAVEDARQAGAEGAGAASRRAGPRGLTDGIRNQ
nr:TetR/AcrR family transcriptional regulator [Streptomyces sp. S1D4-11]QIY94036.1 TetR family transcriptional regulator [Streptomyces sp. S1D4-11]